MTPASPLPTPPQDYRLLAPPVWEVNRWIVHVGAKHVAPPICPRCRSALHVKLDGTRTRGLFDIPNNAPSYEPVKLVVQARKFGCRRCVLGFWEQPPGIAHGFFATERLLAWISFVSRGVLVETLCRWTGMGRHTVIKMRAFRTRPVSTVIVQETP